ncbi:MAG: polyprenyl synthetase family protein [Ruminococcaceae bacterium]|nr:polyprenyl synthetase family protein [Oscillospiraceae bacterium]
MNFEKLEYALRQNCEDTERVLVEFFEKKNNDALLEVIMQAQKYSLLAGGKRIRPFLVNEVCRMLGGEARQSMPFAIAVEMIHTYSLIHDDLPCMDNDDMRRGKPTNHKVYGEANALLAGDALLTNAFLAAASNEFVSAERITLAIAEISRAAGDEGMIGGQIIDLAGEGRKLDFEELLKLHSLKTGRMIELSARLGCIAAGFENDSEESRRVCSYARKIGLAFQVIDDVLDVVGDETVVGKTLSSDAQNQKTTFISFFDVDNAVRYALELTQEAIKEIESIPNSKTLQELAKYLVSRNK